MTKTLIPAVDYEDSLVGKTLKVFPGQGNEFDMQHSRIQAMNGNLDFQVKEDRGAPGANRTVVLTTERGHEFTSNANLYGLEPEA